MGVNDIFEDERQTCNKFRLSGKIVNIFDNSISGRTQYNPFKNTLNIDNSRVISILEYINGLIISTENGIYKLEGEIGKSSLNKISDAKTIENTEFYHETKQLFGILTNQGVIMFSNDGQVQNLSENIVDFSNYDSGSAMFKMQDGIQSVVFSLNKIGDDTQYQTNDYKNNRIVY